MEQAYSAGKATALCQSGSSPSVSLNACEYLPVLEQNSRTPQYKSWTFMLFTPCTVDNKFTMLNQQTAQNSSLDSYIT